MLQRLLATAKQMGGACSRVVSATAFCTCFRATCASSGGDGQQAPSHKRLSGFTACANGWSLRSALGHPSLLH